MRLVHGAGPLLAGSLTVGFLAAELLLGRLVTPSPRSSGLLFGRELPPLRLIPDDYEYRDLADPVTGDTLHLDGRLVTGSDFKGFFRQDELLGYAPRERSVSPAGWWHINELGARHDRPVRREVPTGKRRVLVFGDSYAVGSRVRQEETWSHQLSRLRPDLEVVNFGVDGYGLAQAYLRYSLVRDALDHDEVLLVFAPTENLWRDVNTMRSLVGWGLYQAVPRFMLEGDSLVLVRSPYERLEDLLAENRPRPSPRFGAHLVRYDRLYRPRLHELEGPLTGSVVYRLGVGALERRRLGRIVASTRMPGSEAMRVSLAILRRMAGEVRARGGRFMLVVMPTETGVREWPRQERYRRWWAGLAGPPCEGEPDCLDLAPALAREPPDSFDLGHTGDHHGPGTSRLIARAVAERLFPR